MRNDIGQLCNPTQHRSVSHPCIFNVLPNGTPFLAETEEIHGTAFVPLTQTQTRGLFTRLLARKRKRVDNSAQLIARNNREDFEDESSGSESDEW